MFQVTRGLAPSISGHAGALQQVPCIHGVGGAKVRPAETRKVTPAGFFGGLRPGGGREEGLDLSKNYEGGESRRLQPARARLT